MRWRSCERHEEQPVVVVGGKEGDRGTKAQDHFEGGSREGFVTKIWSHRERFFFRLEGDLGLGS